MNKKPISKFDLCIEEGAVQTIRLIQGLLVELEEEICGGN